MTAAEITNANSNARARFAWRGAQQRKMSVGFLQTCWCGLALASALATAACTSRPTDDSDLLEPDIAVVPEEPAVPRGEIRLVDGLLSAKRLPPLASRALFDLLTHRERNQSRLYDKPIKELVKIACEHDDAAIFAVIDGSEIDEIFPLDRARDAEAAGCGVFFVGGKKIIKGALFQNNCFSTRLAAVHQANAEGAVRFERCPAVTPTRREPKASPPPPTALGNAPAMPTVTEPGSAMDVAQWGKRSSLSPVVNPQRTAPPLGSALAGDTASGFAPSPSIGGANTSLDRDNATEPGKPAPHSVAPAAPAAPAGAVTPTSAVAPSTTPQPTAPAPSNNRQD